MMTQRSARLLALASVLACVAPRAAGAQGLTDTRWAPWLGCWAPVAVQPTQSTDEPTALPPAAAPEATALLCVSPAPDGVGVVVTTVRKGEELAQRTLVADGVEREVEVEGCRGVESARWSQDNGRVYYRTAYTCEGGIGRRSSGATMMLSNGHWLDAELVQAGDSRELEVRRYRAATDAEYRAHGLEPPAGNALALETARKAAAATISISDVIEAVEAVDEEVVQAVLVDYGRRFPVDAEALVRLADAGVSGETIDLIIALSYPERFVVDRGALAVAFRPPEAQAAAPGVRAGDAYGDAAWSYGYPGFWSSSRIWRFGYPWGFDDYRYGYPGFDGLYYWPYSRRWIDPGYGGPIIVVERKEDAGGRAVAGGGYTRTDKTNSRGKAVPRAGAPQPDMGRSSAVAPASGSRATSTSGRATSSGGRASSNGGYRAGDDRASTGDTGTRKAQPRSAAGSQ